MDLLKSVLQDLGLDAYLCTLEANGIQSVELLKELTQQSDELKEIFPHLVDRLTIKSHFRKAGDENSESTNSVSVGSSAYVTTPAPATSPDVERPPKKYIIVDEFFAQTKDTSQNVQAQPVAEDVQNFTGQVVVVRDLPQPSPQPKSKLEDLLDANITGRAIKALYEARNVLDSRSQSYLVDIIVQHYLNLEPFR